MTPPLSTTEKLAALFGDTKVKLQDKEE